MCTCMYRIASLTGCVEIEKAGAAVNHMFVAYKALDFEEAQTFNAGANTSDSEEESISEKSLMLMEQLFDKLDYKILSSENN